MIKDKVNFSAVNVMLNYEMVNFLIFLKTLNSSLFIDKFVLLSKSKYIFIEILIPLFSAGLIYLFLRPNETVIFKIVEIFGLGDLIGGLKNSLNPENFPKWFVYSLPGGLWLLSFQNTISLLKNFQGKYLGLILIATSFTGIGLEILQLFKITDGSFDLTDIYFYTGVTLLALSNILLVKHKWEIYSEEQYSPKLLGLSFIIFTALIYLADII